MRLSERVYLVGGGTFGFGISHDLDCHVYLIDGGTELALIDAGAGVSIDPILENIRSDGLDPSRLKYLLLTHAHADHAGGAFLWRQKCGVQVAGSSQATDYLSQGDEERISLTVAKAAGVYPQEYVFHPCQVHRTLSEGDLFRVGDLELTALETPGHCSGMLSFLMKDGPRSILFAGDTVFHDGRILMSNVWDCDLQAYVNSIEKLSRYSIDALLPGHMAIAMKNGSRHIQKAREAFQKLAIPPNIL